MTNKDTQHSLPKRIFTGLALLACCIVAGALLGLLWVKLFVAPKAMGWDGIADALGGLMAGAFLGVVASGFLIIMASLRSQWMGTGIAVLAAGLAFLVLALMAPERESAPEVALQPPLQSGVYPWIEPAANTNTNRPIPASVLTGSTTALIKLSVNTYTLHAGASTSDLPKYDGKERLIIVKSGMLALSLNQQKHTLGPGSVAVIPPGQTTAAANGGAEPCQYFVFAYEAKNRPKDTVRNTDPIVVDWETLEVKKSDKGGRRNFFDQATTMFERFEMHVTTLNAGLQSHPPHTHDAEEFILVIEGNVEEQIAEAFKKANPGDLIFLDSRVSHTIKNIGDKPATYFAFQWE